MKKASKIIWGLILVALGIVLGLDILNIVDINFFFDGWWTLFIIVPSLVGLFTSTDKAGSIAGIVVGTFLLLSCRGVIEFEILWKLAIPAVIVFIGLKLLLGGIVGAKHENVFDKIRRDGAVPDEAAAVFSSKTLNYAGQLFRAAKLDSVFGGITIDLTSAVIDSDCAVKVSAVFGSADIIIPDYLNVKINSNSIFGGVSNKKTTLPDPTAPTLYVNAVCVFGGVDIK